jgi:hypothetical protein
MKIETGFADTWYPEKGSCAHEWTQQSVAAEPGYLLKFGAALTIPPSPLGGAAL